MTMNRVEFEKSLEDPLSFWGQKTQAEVQQLLGDRVAMMVNYEQRNPHHCYGLFKHALHTVKGLPEGASVLLKVAAFFHDIGKPEVMQERNGRRVFYGHARKSWEIAQGLLPKLGYLPGETEEICFYIKHHDDFIPWFLSEEKIRMTNPILREITKKNVKIYMDGVMLEEEIFQHCPNPYGLWMSLLDLSHADIYAQAERVYRNGFCVDSREHKDEKIQRVRELIRRRYQK